MQWKTISVGKYVYLMQLDLKPIPLSYEQALVQHVYSKPALFYNYAIDIIFQEASEKDGLMLARVTG